MTESKQRDPRLAAPPAGGRVGARRDKLPLNWPFTDATAYLKRHVLSRPDYDPAVLFVWGQTMATGLLTMLKEVEAEFGRAGHAACRRALVKTGHDIAREMLDNVKLNEVPLGEFASYFASWVNEVIYASIEEARIDDEEHASFSIHYCPHQHVYEPFDCRVQRYIVEGLLAGSREALAAQGLAGKMGEFDAAFDTTIPAGAATCDFRLWRRSSEEESDWNRYSAKLEERALESARAKR